MTRDEFELMHYEAFRDLATQLAQGMIDNPSEYLCGLASPEQQADYYRSCVQAAENYDERLAKKREELGL